MPMRRKCSECGVVLPEGSRADRKTCSKDCRDKRTRRLARTNKERGTHHDPTKMEVNAIVRGDVQDAAHEVMKEELRPIVRDAMTTDVLHQIRNLISLTPKAVEALEADLESEDETVRQRAYTLILRYTMGNPSVAPAPTEAAPPAMVVHFNVPRPGDAPQDTTAGSIEPEDAVELRVCMECGETKEAQEFVGASNRCTTCHGTVEAQLRERGLL